MADIVLVEGNNELNVSLTPIAALNFDMNITGITTAVDKFATAFWVAEVTAVISNPNNVPVTHLIRCIAAYGGDNPDDLSKYIYNRYWRGEMYQDRVLNLDVRLNPGESIVVVSPYYYLNGYHELHIPHYEWDNLPHGSYSAGQMVKVWFRMIDENNYWSPVASVGTYIFK